MNVTEQGKAMKALEDMNLIDDFLFGEVMADEECGLEACRIILSCVLKREVRNIVNVKQNLTSLGKHFLPCMVRSF